MIFHVAGAAAIGWGVGATLNYVRYRLLKHYAQKAVTPEMAERLFITLKANSISKARKLRSMNEFAIMMRCNLEAATTPLQDKMLSELHDEFIVVEGLDSKSAEDVEKLKDKLQALAIFSGKYPILTDEEMEAQMVDLTPA